MSRKSKYALGDDGFAKLIFLDANGVKIHHSDLSDLSEAKGDSKGKEETVYIAQEGFGFEVSKEHKDLVDQGKLTRDVLLSMEITTMLRLATYLPAGKIIEEELGLRGLPLKEPWTLLDHQIQTLTWMRQREALAPSDIFGLRGGVICLNTGLGKTLLSLSLTLTAPKGEFPTLVVASKTVMREWQTEGVQKFFGNNVKILYFHADFIGKNINSITRSDVLQYDVVITTYDVCMSACKKYPYHEETYEIGDDHTMMKGRKVAIHHRTREQVDRPKTKGIGILFCTPWERIFCDESQRFVNPKTVTYEVIMALYGEKMWCLSATPIVNQDVDIWSQLRFCGYKGVITALEWKKRSLTTYKLHKLDEAIFTMDYKEAKITLPPKTEYVNLVTLTGKHKVFYDWVLGQTRLAYDEMMKGNIQFACVLAWFTALRQTAIAPYLFTSQSKRDKPSVKAKKHKEEMMAKLKRRFENSDMYKWLVNKNTDSGIESCKIKEITNIIKRIPANEKVLVFSMFTSGTDLLADAIKMVIPDFKYLQVDGAVTGKERARLLDEFRDPNSGVRGLFMTYKVGSQGLNLVQATHCICIEPWWTDATHRQAKARCWRMGQTKEVHVHNVYVRDTIEEKVNEICKSKNEMASSFLDGTEKPLHKAPGLDKFTLGKILGY